MTRINKLLMMKVLKIIIIVLVIIAILIIVLSEVDRCRPRFIRPSVRMYYESLQWITAPPNVFTTRNVKREVSESRFTQPNFNHVSSSWLNRVIRNSESNLRGRLKYIRDIQDDRPEYRTLYDSLLPFPDMKTNFPDHIILKKNWKRIRDEVLKIYDEGEMKKINNDQFFRYVADDKWTRFYIKWYADSLKDARVKLPFTTGLIDDIPAIRSAMISVLEPGSVVKQHVDPFRGVMRYHLGLVTPKGTDEAGGDNNCQINIDDIIYSWRDGEDILFDGTYVHEVHNNTDQKRIILFCDIQRDLDSNHANDIGEFNSRAASVVTKNNNK